MIEVQLHNESVTGGMTLHWHGVDVPNAEDGVAGVTQNSVLPGQEFTYRFVADHAGTYWYHSHETSNQQVAGGLFGALVVQPRGQAANRLPEVTAIAHTYAGVRTINGSGSDLTMPAKPGRTVRLRVINTDNAPMDVWASGPYRVLAIDGRDLNEPTPVTDQALVVTGGGRADLAVTAPADGSAVRVQLSKGTAVVVGSGTVAAPAQPSAELDLLSYGKPAPLALRPDPSRPALHVLDRPRAGFLSR